MTGPSDIPSAEHHRGWFPGWIWSVPIAAIGIAVWLAVRSIAASGPEVTVVFPKIANLKAGDTLVKFESLVVGQVDSVRLRRTSATSASRSACVGVP